MKVILRQFQDFRLNIVFFLESREAFLNDIRVGSGPESQGQGGSAAIQLLFRVRAETKAEHHHTRKSSSNHLSHFVDHPFFYELFWFSGFYVILCLMILLA